MNNLEQTFQNLCTYVEDLGDVARDYFYSSTSLNEQKTDGSVVTAIDLMVETKLREFIQEHFPGEAILGEEHGLSKGVHDFVWVIDPIDGTDNFVRKIPFFAITVTRLGPTTEGSFAIIYNPISRQLFSTFAGQGVCENGRAGGGSSEVIGGRHFITVTGANSSAPWIKSARQNVQRALYLEFGKSGHYHSSLLEHAYVAVGNLDGLLQIQMSAWDSAAGLCLDEAAKKSISVFVGEEWVSYEGPIKELYGADFLTKPTLFISRPDIHARALQMIGNPINWADQSKS